MGKQQCLLQSLWIHICENLCFWFWFWRGKRKQESVTLATQEAFSCVLDSSTLPWHSICFKLLGLPFSNFTAAPNLQHPRFSCCLFQSDKCISRLNICIPIISEFLGLEVRITGEDNTWYKIIVIQRWNFRQWGISPHPQGWRVSFLLPNHPSDFTDLQNWPRSQPSSPKAIPSFWRLQ